MRYTSLTLISYTNATKSYTTTHLERYRHLSLYYDIVSNYQLGFVLSPTSVFASPQIEQLSLQLRQHFQLLTQVHRTTRQSNDTETANSTKNMMVYSTSRSVSRVYFVRMNCTVCFQTQPGCFTYQA